MRYLFFLLLVAVSIKSFAQKQDKGSIATVISSFDKALVSKDSVELKKLLSDSLSYGHSNGWIETKADVIGDLFNGKLTYKQINAPSPDITVEGKTASARMTVDADVLMDGKPMSFKLKVLQVWVWKNKHWQLFARQSVKM
jgi:hypothetical protein